MFEAFRVIGQGGPAPPPDQPQNADPQDSFSHWRGAGIEEWVSTQLRHTKRRQNAVRAEVEREAEKRNNRSELDGRVSQHENVAMKEKPKASPLDFLRHSTSKLCAEYSKTLTALHVAASTRQRSSLPSLSLFPHSGKEATEDVALHLLSDFIPSEIVWGTTTQLWHSAGHADCPTLRSLAAEIQQHDASYMKTNARLARQLIPTAIRTDASAELGCMLAAILSAETSRKRPRIVGGSLSEDVDIHTDKTKRVAALPLRNVPRGKETVSDASAPSLVFPLRSTSTRAQAAASRSRSRSPPPPQQSDAVTNVLIKPVAHVADNRTASSFSFSVRVAGKGCNIGSSTVRLAENGDVDNQANNDDSSKTHGGQRSSNNLSRWQSGSTTITATSHVDAQVEDSSRHISPLPPSSSTHALRQTTLAAFSTNSGVEGTQTPHQQQPSNPVPTTDSAQNSSPTSSKRSSWYSAPLLSTSSSKAPPYRYHLRGNASGVKDGVDDGPFNRAAPSAISVNNSSGGFVTAGEQLASDMKQGRTMNSAYLSKRSPALGLRRTGFQPPFRDQPQQQGSTEMYGNARGAAPSSSNINADIGRTGKPPTSNTRIPAAVHHDDDEGSYPASLLLPDGSVPPILLPLDPKLVTQVAMEILDSGAGAKQVGWDDIAGLQHAKASVEEAIVWPLRRPDLFVGLRDPPRGLLLFGPPGTGKTMIARAIANRAGCTFLNISSSSLMSKWMGDGEKLVRCLFAVATVRQPSVIFIDEIDSLLSMRGEGEMDSVRRVKTEFLVQLDGVATDRGDRVLLIGATNRPDELDEAARRRMEKRLYIPLPDEAARRELIQRLMRSLSSSGTDEVAESPTPRAAVVHTLTDADLDSLVRHTHGYSGADLKQLCREAAMGPLREMSVGQLSEVAVTDLRPIERRDFRQALKRLKPSVGPAEVKRYVEWNRLFGSFDHGSEKDEEDADSSDGSDN